MDAVFGLVLLLALVFGFALLYKKRHALAKWLEDPSMAISSDPKAKKLSLEYKANLIKREMEILDEIEVSKKDSPVQTKVDR